MEVFDPFSLSPKFFQSEKVTLPIVDGFTINYVTFMYGS